MGTTTTLGSTRALRRAITAALASAVVLGCGGQPRHTARTGPPPAARGGVVMAESAPAADMAGPTAPGQAHGAPAPHDDAQHAHRADYQSGERYARLQENDFMEAARDAMATFSLDVDTASYTIMRRDLRSGRLPRPDSVRVEEYINFFDYGDGAPTPTDDAPFAVHLESAPSPFGQGMHLLRTAVQGMEIPAGQRPRANLVFLIDVSGSMRSADKLPLVKYALNALVHALRSDDRIGIVVYAGREAVALEPTSVRHRGAVLEAIQDLRAGGSTNGEGGIRAAYDLASQHFHPEGINRVILCTDGDFNVGLRGEALVDLIEAYRERDITLTTLGFGRGNINDRDMEKLADHGNGNYHYIDGRNQALRVLQRDLGGTLQVIAKDVKVQVAFNPEVVGRFRLIGYENRVLAHEDFDDDTVDAAEIGSGQFTTAFVEYELREDVEPGADPRTLAEVRLRYKEPKGDQSRRIERTVRVRDIAPQLADASSPFRFGAAVAEYGEILRRSKHSDGAPFEQVARIAEEAADFGSPEDAQQFVGLVRQAGALWNRQ